MGLKLQLQINIFMTNQKTTKSEPFSLHKNHFSSIFDEFFLK